MRLAFILSLCLLAAGCAPNPPIKQGNVEVYEYSVFYVGFGERELPECMAKRARLVNGAVRLEC